MLAILLVTTALLGATIEDGVDHEGAPGVAPPDLGVVPPPSGSATATLPPGVHLDVNQLDPGRCVSDDEIKKAHEAENPEAFSDSAIPLGPFFWASRDRTFLQVMLVYWRYLGIEDRSRLDVTFPFWLSSCTPTSETAVGPLGLFAWKTDQKGTAGFVGPYFFRRDDDAESDVVFPLYWHLADKESRTLVLGPVFDVEGRGISDYGFFPLYWGERNGNEYFDVTPLGARWGTRDETHLWLLQTFASRTPRGWDVQSWPLYFAGESLSGAHHTVIPPLLTAHWGDDDSENTIVAQSWLFDDKTGWDAGSFPFYAGGRRGDHYYDLSPIFARWGDRRRGDFWTLQTFAGWDPDSWAVASIPFYFGGASSTTGSYYHVVPLLLTALWGDKRDHNTIVGPYWSFEHALRVDEGLFPFYARGSHTDSSYFLTPLFGAWGDSLEQHVWVLQTFADTTKTSWDVHSWPFYFGGEDGRGGYHHDIPLALTFLWGDADGGGHQNIVAGPWFDLRTGDSHDAGLLPLYVEGDVHAGGGERPPIASLVASVSREWFGPTPLFDDAFHYRLVPPLLYAHVGNGDAERTIFAQSWLFRDKGGWDAGSFPLYAGGRRGDDYYDLTPLFARWGDAENHQLIAGPWFDIESPGGSDYGVFPVYFAGSALDGFHYHVVPALFENWGDAHDDNTLLLQSWLLTSDDGWDAGSFPFFAAGHHNRDFYGASLLGGFWGDGTNTSLLALQTWASWDAHSWAAVSFPFYFGGGSVDGSYAHVIPPLLTAAWGDPKEHNLIAGPFWDFDDGTSQQQGLFPLYARGADSSGSYFSIPALLTIAWDNAEGKSLIAGPWFQTDDKDGAARGLFPLYFSGESKDDSSHWRLVPPLLYGHFGDVDEELTIFAQSFLYRDLQHPSSWSAGSLPFYLGGRDASDDSYYDLTLLGGRIGDKRSTTIYALQSYASWDASSWSAASFPFYFGGDDGNRWHELALPLVLAWGDRALHEDTELVLPPAYMHWHTNEDDATLIGPYYGRTRVDGTSAHALAPFWFSGTARDTSWDVLLPVFAAWGGPEERRGLVLPTLTYWSSLHGEDWLIAPLTWHEKTRERDDTIVFPFWWGFSDADSRALVVSGLWWDFGWKHEGKSLQIAPGYLRWEDPDEVFTIAGPLSWSNGKGEHAAEWSFHLFPLFSIWSYHPGHIRWRALIAGFGYEEDKQADQTRRQLMILGMKFDASDHPDH